MDTNTASSSLIEQITNGKATERQCNGPHQRLLRQSARWLEEGGRAAAAVDDRETGRTQTSERADGECV